MSFWNEDFYFQKRGDRYVYRPTVFSAGFDISESEKDRLFAGLKRLQWRSLSEGLLAIALIAILFMTGMIESEKPIPWFLVASILAVAALGLTVLRRRDQLVFEILGPRSPDVPRLPIGQALATPRPKIGRQYAIPVLRSVVFLFALTIAVIDALVVYLVVTAYHARRIAEGPDEIASMERFFAHTVDSWQFWAVVAGLNAGLITVLVMLIFEVRRLRDISGPD